MFPLGLRTLLHVSDNSVNGLLVLLWLMYTIHAIITFLEKNTVRLAALWVILASVLTLNVVGCRGMQHNPLVNPNYPEN